MDTARHRHEHRHIQKERERERERATLVAKTISEMVSTRCLLQQHMPPPPPTPPTPLSPPPPPRPDAHPGSIIESIQIQQSSQSLVLYIKPYSSTNRSRHHSLYYVQTRLSTGKLAFPRKSLSHPSPLVFEVNNIKPRRSWLGSSSGGALHRLEVVHAVRK